VTLSHAVSILHTHSQLIYKHPLYIPMQVTPSPVYPVTPVLQLQVKLPSLFAQMARGLTYSSVLCFNSIFLLWLFLCAADKIGQPSGLLLGAQ